MAKKKPADHRTRLYRGSYERQTYLLRAELRIIRDDIRRLLSHVFVEHPIAIMLDPDPSRVEQVAHELMEEDKQRAKDKKKVKHKAHQHIGVVVTFMNPQQEIWQVESGGLYCMTTGDISVYNFNEDMLPAGWKIRLTGRHVGPASGIWMNPDHHKEVTGASENDKSAKGPGD